MSSRLRLHFPIVYRRLCLCDKSVNLDLKPDRSQKRNWGRKENWRMLGPAVTILNPAVEQSKRRCAYKNCVLCTTGLKNPWAAGHRTSRRLVAELCGGEHILALSQSGPEPDTWTIVLRKPTSYHSLHPPSSRPNCGSWEETVTTSWLSY